MNNLTNNEAIGIAAEVAIADSFGLAVSNSYRDRANTNIINSFLSENKLRRIFDNEHIPYPIRHVAENQNSTDFELCNGSTLSVKTNMKELGKAAPEIIGQPTCKTYFDFLINYNNKHNIIPNIMQISHTREGFKAISIDYIDKLMIMYWNNMFICDYLLHFYNILNNGSNWNYFLLKQSKSPNWDKNVFSFTKNKLTWNESNTVKYAGITIGEFQAHNNRDCLKFRFNIKGIAQLYDNRII